MRADICEQVVMARVVERAWHHRLELDKRLARLIRNELTDAENKRRR